MRQHAIPQNVLDVEFKLFTRFTVKEFVYLTAGVSIGVIFIYLWTENSLDWFISLPAFLFFTGLGLILGLVPINDQPADKFLMNYINAINNPTQRVWQNKEFKDKLEIIAKERGLTFEQIQVDPNKKSLSIKKGSHIIGGLETKTNKETEDKPKNVFDLEEEDKLQKINTLFEETGLIPKKKNVTQNTSKTEKSQAQSEIIINKDNMKNYKIENKDVKLNGTINLVLNENKDLPVSGATVIIKDQFEKPILALKSGLKGEVISNKVLPKGEFNINILHEQYTFPKIRFLVEDKVYPLVKIKSL